MRFHGSPSPAAAAAAALSSLPPPFTNSSELIALQRRYPALSHSQMIKFATWFYSLTSHSKSSASSSSSGSASFALSSPSSSFSLPLSPPSSPSHRPGPPRRSSSPSSQSHPASASVSSSSCSLPSLKDHFLEFEYFANLLLSTSLIHSKQDLLLACSSAGSGSASASASLESVSQTVLSEEVRDAHWSRVVSLSQLMS
jgi:hypothetical protein